MPIAVRITRVLATVGGMRASAADARLRRRSAAARPGRTAIGAATPKEPLRAPRLRAGQAAGRAGGSPPSDSTRSTTRGPGRPGRAAILEPRLSIAALDSETATAVRLGKALADRALDSKTLGLSEQQLSQGFPPPPAN